jgi:hypothetical protein
MFNSFCNIYFYFSLLLSKKILGFVDFEEKKIIKPFLSNYLPLFFYFPCVYFYNLEYLYTIDNKIKLEKFKKRNLKISPLVSKIQAIIKSTHRIYIKDITFINDKYSHDIPFWIITEIENFNNFDKILFTKEDLFNKVQLEYNFKDIEKDTLSVLLG